MILKHAALLLTGPICPCEEEDLSWGVTCLGKEGHGLRIMCETCGVEVWIPPSQLKATVELEVPYPGKAKPDRRAHLAVLDGGKGGDDAS